MIEKITKRIMAVLALSLIAISNFAQSKTIRVLDHSGNPIVGAAVSRNTSDWQSPVLTDANGEVTFTDGTQFEVSYNNTSFTDSYSLDGETVTVYTTLVTIKGYDDTGAPLAGIANTYFKGDVKVFGTTDDTGAVSKELFPDTYSFTSTYNSSDHVRNVIVEGDGYTENTETIIETYLSRATFKATSFQDANVSEVSISYYKEGAYISFPETDVNGESSRLMYPGEYNQFKASINSTSTDEFSVVVPGDASIAETPAAKKVTVLLNPIRVKFDNYDQPSNTIKVQYHLNSEHQSISGDAHYMFPGTYELIFPLKDTSTSFKRDVKIANDGTHNYEKVVSIIRLIDHSGAPLTIEAIRGGYGTRISYHVNATTNFPSPVSNDGDYVWIDLSNTHTNRFRMFEVRKNNSRKTESKDVYANNFFDFQTKLMTLRLETCDGIGLPDAEIRYGAGTTISNLWGEKTDANGETSKELFEGDYTIEMRCNRTEETRQVPLADNDVFTWTTQLVKINYPKAITYGGDEGISNHFPSTKQHEMLADTIKFRFTTDVGHVFTSVTIPAATSGVCNDFIITPVILRLIDSNGNPLIGGKAEYYESSLWTEVGETDANGEVVFPLINDNEPKPITRITYRGLTLQKVNLNTVDNDNVITYQTKEITVKLLDYDNNPLVSDTVLYNDGETWVSVGSGITDTETGGVSDEFLPVNSVSFTMSLNGTCEQKDENNLELIDEVVFKATKVYVHYKDNTCSPVAGSEIEYYGNGWKSMGTTDASGATAFTYFLPSADPVMFRCKNAPGSERAVSILAQPEQHVYVGYCEDNIWIGSTGTDWNISANWSNNEIPSSGENVLFDVYAENDLLVPINDAKTVGNLTNPSSKDLIIPADASLTINGVVNIADAVNPTKIQIKAAPNKANGTLILNADLQRISAQPDVYATVDLYAKGYKSATERTWIDKIPGSPTFGESFKINYKWQYFGIPVQSVIANPTFAGSFIRQYHEDQNGITYYNKWRSITNNSILQSFKGYEITQNAPAIYSISGILVYGDQELKMTRNAPEVNGVRYGLGQNLFGNSFTASISVNDIVFPEEAEKVVYLYNTGSLADWYDELAGTNDGSQMVAGQYTAIPKKVAPVIFEGKIPSMNGFVVMFNDVNTVVGDAKYLTVKYASVSKNSRPQTAPRASLSWLEIGLQSQSTIDKLWLINDSDVEEKGNNNGWNGRKFFGTPTAFIYSESSTGPMQVHTKKSLDGAVLSFYANSDKHYKLIINRSNLQGYDNLKLVDLETGVVIPLTDKVNTYSFKAGKLNQLAHRFQLFNTADIQQDRLQNLNLTQIDNDKVLVVNLSQKLGKFSVFNVAGLLVFKKDVKETSKIHQLSLLPGIYILKLAANGKAISKKIIIR